MMNCKAIHQWSQDTDQQAGDGIEEGAKGADWTNYNRSLMQSCDGLRTLMEDARGGLIR